MQRDRPKFRKAHSALVSMIGEGRFDESGRLPSIAALAQITGVSKAVMWDVVKVLCREGRILGAPRRRAWLPGMTPGDKPLQPSTSGSVRRSKRHDLQVRIRSDILNGVYGTGQPLPAVKELADRYGVCQPTLRKALRVLVEQEEVISRRGRFFSSSIKVFGGRSATRIVLLGYGYNIGHSIAYGYWHQEYVKLLEVECAKANIALDVVCFARDEAGALRFYKGLTLPDTPPIAFTGDPDVLGYVYEITGGESVEDELLATVAGWGKPVAMLDEMGFWPPASRVRRYPTIRIFRNTVTDQPARQVARFGLELGHRSAVFLSPHHESEYSVRRLEGLARTFADCPGAKLTPVTSSASGDYPAQGATRIHLDRLTASFERWRKDVPYAYGRMLDNHFQMLPALVAGGRIHEDLDRLIDRALNIDDATLWIGVNDACAHYAIDILEERGIPVPGAISVISFDDEPDALRVGLTSYNFNQSATAVAMLSYITSPRRFPPRKPVVEIEGRIIPRRTTGPARGA